LKGGIKVTFYNYPSSCAFCDDECRCWCDRDGKFICSDIDVALNENILWDLGYVEYYPLF
jgi:hypothetical protein